MNYLKSWPAGGFVTDFGRIAAVAAFVSKGAAATSVGGIDVCSMCNQLLMCCCIGSGECFAKCFAAAERLLSELWTVSEFRCRLSLSAR